MNTNNPAVNEWIYFAQMDYYDCALYLAQNRRPAPVEIICYHCQQSVEKILKGYIAAHGGTIIKTHDLKVLIEQCRQYSSDFDDYAKSCFALTAYISSTRYPPKPELMEQDMERALKDALEILEFTKSKLKEMGYEYKPVQAGI
jgi:HEPN domain-containing protein